MFDVVRVAAFALAKADSKSKDLDAREKNSLRRHCHRKYYN